MKKIPAYVCLLLLAASLFCGCSKKVEPSPSPDILPTTTPPMVSETPSNEDVVPSPDNGNVTDGNNKVSPSPDTSKNARGRLNDPGTK